MKRGLKKVLFSILILLIAAVCPAQTIPQPEPGGWWPHKPQPHKPQPLTLWGITMDAPPPQFPTCGENISEETKTCVRKATKIYLDDDIYNLLDPSSRSVAHILEEHGKVVGFSVVLSIDDYPLVLEALTRKLERPMHNSFIMQNGFGAHWQADIYQWDVVDGSLVKLQSHFSDSDELKLFVQSAESVKKDAANKPTIKEP